MRLGRMASLLFSLIVSGWLAAGSPCLAASAKTTVASPPKPASWLGLRKITLEPTVGTIIGTGNTHHFLATASFADGSERDVTQQVAISIDTPDVLRPVSPGLFEARKEGIAKLRATLAGFQSEAVVVVQPRRTLQIDFATQVAPVFSKLGCNNTNCHGALNGQSGFKLSLFGYDPEADYHAVVEASEGRRLNLKEPEKSLLLQKPTFAIPHGGGELMKKDPANLEYRTLVNWIQSGVPRSAAGSPRLVRIEAFPKSFRILEGKGARQQILVIGHYGDGSREDITDKVRYTSNREEVAEVSPQGLISAKTEGEAAIMVRSLGQVAAVRIGVAASQPIPKSALAPANFVDELVFDKLSKLRIETSGPATDAEFMRRVYLDLMGIVPEPEEARRFLTDTSPNKRARLVDALLERPEYADFWAMKWGDLLANSVLVVHDGTAYLQDWLRESFRTNKPYDRFVRELLTATGSSWDSGAVNYFARTPEDLVAVTSQVFLGVGLECARCHDHPSEKWKRDDFIGLTAFFSQVGSKGRRPPPVESITYLVFDQEYRHPETRQIVKPRLLDGTEPIIRPLEDRRKVLADWITSPQNPWFARATVNRIWRQLMGHGLVEPVDDIRVTNPATNEVLLDKLADDFVKYQFDLQHLMRTVLNSATYQRSSVPKPGNAKDELNYSHYYLRRLTAEQLLDSIVQITGVPEEFLAYYPGIRSANIDDPGVPSMFLDIYDRPKRDAARCERKESVSLRQSMHMLVGDTVNKKISDERGTLARMVRKGKDDAEIVEHFYLAALSRLPTPQEQMDCSTVIARASAREKGLQNVLWALLNGNEFLYNH